MPPLLTIHSSHHYPTLLRRWREVARRGGLRMSIYAEQDGFPLYFIESRKVKKDTSSIYLSAGVHGDEPGATEGMIAWAEEKADFAETNFTIFPCLNPWGLTNNSRYTSRGHDLNRQFHNHRLRAVRAWQQLLLGRRFNLSITLHEDYDAHGVYFYELSALKEAFSPSVLELTSAIIPTDGRTRVDGRKMTHPGYFHRSARNRKLPDGPEAIWMARNHANVCFTVETPSEFSLDLRVEVQKIIIETLIRRFGTEII